MKKRFMVSLCHQGLLGGWITADENAMTYWTGKVTVDARYRRLVMPYREMAEVQKKPLTLSLHMKNGEVFTFMVFARKRFVKLLLANGVKA